MRTAIRIPPALTVFVIAAAVVMTAPAAVLAFPPTADAGGPYTIAEGEALTLDGSGSFDPDLDPDGQHAQTLAPVIHETLTNAAAGIPSSRT